MSEPITRFGVSRTLHSDAIRRTVAALVAALTVSAALGDASELDPKTVLTHVRDATGYAQLDRLDNGVLLTGKTKHYGDDGAYSLLFNPDGRFVEKIEARLDSTIGFDGREGWCVDWSSLPSTLELEDLEMALAPQWVHTGRWLAENGPFAITVNVEETTTRNAVLDMRLGSSALTWKLVVDRESWLPTELSLDSKGGTDRWTFADYREFEDVTLARRVAHEDGAGKTDSVEITEVATPARVSNDPYKRITKRPADTHFNPDAPAAIEVKVTPTGHLLVHPRVGGQDVGWFIFDTGAGAMVIAPAVADAAKMPAFGEVTANGAGGMLDARFRQGDSFTIGRVTIDNPVYVELDLSFLTPFFGIEVAGICGYDLLARVVAEFDPYRRKISLLDPAEYHVPNGAEWRELIISGRHPYVHASFEGDHEGVFRLDTGTPDTVTFHAPAVESLKLLDGRETTSGVQGGAGGMKLVRSGAIEWFELAGHRFEQPVVTFGLSDEGAMSGDLSVGTIGLKFLEPFVVVFDYPHKRIAFAKRQ